MDANKRILFVDDDINMLNSVRRQLRGQYDLLTAESGEEAQKILSKEKEISVIISDYKMPKMNGVQFLMRAKEIAPDSVRMMLTGQADFEAVIEVINQGNIFRFLSKPCPPELLIKNIDDGIKQHQLITAEKELLSKTLSGSLQVMTDLLVLAKPEAFNKGIRIKNIIGKMLKHLDAENPWQIEIAAMLSQIGCITIPDSILKKVFKNDILTADDKLIYQLHAQTSSELIEKIPRLEKVAGIIAYQEKYYNGTGFPYDDIKEDELPLGSRMIRLVSDYDSLISMDISIQEAIEALNAKIELYDPSLIPILEKALHDDSVSRKYVMKKVAIDELNEKMYLAKPVVSASGVILGSAKQRVTKSLVVTLKNYAKNREIEAIITVLQMVE